MSVAYAVGFGTFPKHHRVREVTLECNCTKRGKLLYQIFRPHAAPDRGKKYIVQDADDVCSKQQACSQLHQDGSEILQRVRDADQDRLYEVHGGQE
jgi:hypothetical protein